jgi:membrane-anchored glycerophosphoryl diester phosphodiesterase (GDPDase)
VVVATAHRGGSTTSVTTVPAGLTAALIAVSFVLDVVLTFVVPALSLTTRSVTTSLRLGWRVMTRSWPTSLWYLFAPGITLLALTGALPHSVISTEASVVLGLFSTLLGLWFKGANVAFYIRSVPPPSVDGAA